MDDRYVCDYCTAAFGDIRGLEEHMVNHLTVNEEDLRVLQDLIQHPERNARGEKGKTPLGNETNFSEAPYRSVESQENESSVMFPSKSSLIKPTESENHQRHSIPCCNYGYSLTKHSDIHKKLASKQVLMEHQCEGCSMFFETVEYLENHCREGRCKDFNHILQIDLNFSALVSKNNSPGFSQNGESANQASKNGQFNNCFYKCGKCEHLCLDFNDLLVHEETHMDMQPFLCVICHADLSNYFSYLAHIEKHRNPDANTQNHLHNSLECKKCHKSFGNAWDLLMHDKSKHIDLYPFRCFACSKKFQEITPLRCHKKLCYMYMPLSKERLGQNFVHRKVLQHNNAFKKALLKFHAIFFEGKSLEKDIVCPVCKKKEGSVPDLTHHFAGHFGFLQCVYCNEPFKRDIAVERHMPCDSELFACQQCQQGSAGTEIHSDLVCCGEKKKKYDPIENSMYSQKCHKIMILCDICGLTITKTHFSRHRKTHNKPSSTDNDVHCPKCNALFESHFQLKMHLKWHHKTKDKIQCKFCQKMLSTNATLQVHVSKFHSEREAKFECFECKKKFMTKSELNKHRNIHLSESKPYKCDQCEAAFAQNCNLTKHKIIHTGERPYKCDKCDAAFAHRSNLNKHSSIHTGKYSFRCDICNRGFDSMRPLTMHKESHYRLSRYLK